MNSISTNQWISFNGLLPPMAPVYSQHSSQSDLCKHKSDLVSLLLSTHPKVSQTKGLSVAAGPVQSGSLDLTSSLLPAHSALDTLVFLLYSSTHNTLPPQAFCPCCSLCLEHTSPRKQSAYFTPFLPLGTFQTLHLSEPSLNPARNCNHHLPPATS